MSSLNQAPHLGYLPSPHSAFQEHAAHMAKWSAMLSSNGSRGTCIPRGLSTFLQYAFTAHHACLEGKNAGETDARKSPARTLKYIRQQYPEGIRDIMSTECNQLLDHLVRLDENARRDGNPESLGGLEVDDQLKLGGLLDGQVSWLGTFENFVHVGSGTPDEVKLIWSIGHEASSDHPRFPTVHHGQSAL